MTLSSEVGQAVGRPLEQQPPPERPGRLAEGRADQAVEVEAREVRPAGEVVAAEVGLVEAALDEVEDPAQAVLIGASAQGVLGHDVILAAAAYAGS